MNTKILINRIIKIFSVRSFKEHEKIVYLTFDDGPEIGITEFILSELSKYDYKATFFCRGDNASNNANLLKKIHEYGHSIGNHTFSHIKGFDTPTQQYLTDVKRADYILQSNLFRPPWGALKLCQFLKLARKYRIIYWNSSSGDTKLDSFDLNREFESLKNATKAGNIVLFHCCKRHENETRKILPKYCEWLSNNGWTSKAIKNE
jgi:peptidoglycan/xylan/chitin deacetylase (PgdA/CDA1 family)